MSSAQSGLQSGIAVSPALVTAFNEASTSPATRALKISIKGESLEPNGTFDRSSTAEEDFSRLEELFSDNEAGYAIYFLDDPLDTYIFISYVPDTTNVRSKMLYAATRSSLISTLGLRTQRLHSQLIASSKSDLKFPSTQVTSLATSLSDLSVREQELAQVKAAEAEGAHGTGKRTNLVSSSGVSFPVSEEAKAAIAGLASDEADNLVQLVGLANLECIEEETIDLAAVNSVEKDEEIRDIIFEEEPRFTFFRFHHDYKAKQTTSIVFIYSCPTSSSIKNRMLYASSRSAILSVASELGIKVETKIETSEVDELTLKYLLKEVHGDEHVVDEKKKGFARPKGPMRRVQRMGTPAGSSGGEGESGTE